MSEKAGEAIWVVLVETLTGYVMQRLFEAGVESLLFSVVVLAVLVAVAVYVIGKVRSKAIQQEPIASKLLPKFRESHSRGELSDAEFRTIKTTLASQLQEELKDNGEMG